jgi:hypothetical protein
MIKFETYCEVRPKLSLTNGKACDGEAKKIIFIQEANCQ